MIAKNAANQISSGGEPNSAASPAKHREHGRDHRIAHVAVRALDDQTPSRVPGRKRPPADASEQPHRPKPEREPGGDQGEAEENRQSGHDSAETPADVRAGADEDGNRHQHAHGAGEGRDRTGLAPDAHAGIAVERIPCGQMTRRRSS